MNRERERISIVGGGIIGTSLAYRLRESSFDVTLYEREAVGEGATAASMAVFTWQSLHPTALGYRLCRDSWAEYETLVEAGELEFTPTGALDVASSPEDRETVVEAAEGLRELGVDARALDAEEVAQYGISPRATYGGLYTEREGYFDPAELVSYYCDRAAAAGVEIATDTEVTGILVEDGAVSAIETENEVRETDVIVNAAGPWAPDLNDLVGLDLPLRRTRGPILDVRASAPDLPFTLFERSEEPSGYLRPHETGIYAGRYATGYDQGETLDPDREYSTDARFEREVRNLLEKYMPDVADADLEEGWVGIRTVSPDGLPLVGGVGADGAGKREGLSGFVVACGPSGLGITRAPAISDLLARFFETGRVSDDLDALSPARFEDRVTDRP